MVELGLNSGLHTCKAGALLHNPQPPVPFALVILGMGSDKLFAQAGHHIKISQVGISNLFTLTWCQELVQIYPI
jgi:uncharacterized membrane protein